LAFSCFFGKHSREKSPEKRYYTGGIVYAVEGLSCMKKIFRKLSKNKWMHFIAWSIFLIYEILLVGIAYGAFGHPVTYALHYSIVILYFYFMSEFGLTWAFRSSRSANSRLPIVLILSFLVYLIARYMAGTFLQYFGFVNPTPKITIDQSVILKDLYRYVYFSAFSMVYFFTRKYIAERKRARELEEQRLNALLRQEQISNALIKAENDYLRAQINPHFLFNTLNFVHNTIYERPGDASSAVILLSDIMRYAVETSNMDGTIKIEDEEKQLIKLLSLYSLRINKEPNIDLIIEETVKELCILPLLLLTLLENIFKHGNLVRKSARARMEIFLENDVLVITTQNLINSKPDKSGTHNGMLNLRERITNAYGKNGSIAYGELTSRFFTVVINIALKAITPEHPGSPKLYT